MGFFENLLRKKKENAHHEDVVLICDDKSDGDTVSDWDFQYSQSIYDRNLIGVSIYEIEPVLLADSTQRNELYTGEYIGMTEGRMMLGVQIRSDDDYLLNCDNRLTLSYSRHGESFFVEVKIIKATGADKATTSAHIPDSDESSVRWDHYIIELILCAEPTRHHRKHGRIDIGWNVYYRVIPYGQDNEQNNLQDNGQDDAVGDEEGSDYSVTKTINISEGGFKSIVEKQLAVNTRIECIVEVDNHKKSKGVLIGSVIRCNLMVDNLAMFEMTVRFDEIDDQVREFLVTSIENEHPGAVDADARITISSDRLEALIELSPPRNNGSDLSFEALSARLASEGVVYGIDNDALVTLSEKPYYNLETVIARGTPPAHGDDAVLTYLVGMDHKLAPMEYEDGTVDFKNLGLIQQVYKGAVLVEKTMLTEGAHGVCVTGERSEAKPGKDKKLPTGANTVVNESETALLADIDGGISIVDDKINVFSTYMVEGDVQYETGNINYNGIVVIKGDVRYGFAVKATGDVVIHGTVESAAITAGGSLIVQGGCVGEENAIEAGGDLAAKFIDGGSFNVRGNLKTTYIINSTIKCGGSIDMIGSGIIRNSHVIAQTAISAKIIGSVRAAADKTVVEVGNDPELLGRFVSLTKRLEQLDKDIESFDISIRALTLRKYKMELSDEKIRALEKSKALVKQLIVQQEELTDEHRMLKERINALGYGIIRVQNTAYEGLRVIIGSYTSVLKDSVRSVKFSRGEDGIIFSPLK